MGNKNIEFHIYSILFSKKKSVLVQINCKRRSHDKQMVESVILEEKAYSDKADVHYSSVWRSGWSSGVKI
jgi:hypothetical protein